MASESVKIVAERNGSSEGNNKLCKRCKSFYDPRSNTPESCRFHPSFFVCRRHDDQRRYYELGPYDPPYAAKFFDCCGAEDMDAPGCSVGFHISYDGDCGIGTLNNNKYIQSKHT